MNLKTSWLCALAGMLLIAHHAPAATIVWDGTTDNNWTNGPQDNSGGGAFPANGATGSNWTVDANPPGGLAVPDANTPGGNMIDYDFTGHDWTIAGATINEDVQIKLSGGTLAIRNSSVSLQPTSATTGANLSGLNVGQSSAVTATITSSTVTAGRSNAGGNAFRVMNGSSLIADDSTVATLGEAGATDFNIRQASSVSLINGSILDAEDEVFLETNDSKLTITSGDVNAAAIRTNNDSTVVFDTGDITLTNANAFRSSNSFNGTDFNWIGDAGDGLITTADNSDSQGRTLAFKVWQGYFSIDGAHVSPNGDGLLPGFDGTVASQIDDLNDLLSSTYTIGGRYFEIGFNAVDPTMAQTLQLVNVPEPATLVLAALSLVCCSARRRRQI